MIIIDDFFPKDIQEMLWTQTENLDFKYSEDTVGDDFKNFNTKNASCPQIVHTLFNEWYPKYDSFQEILKLFQEYGKKSLKEFGNELFDNEYNNQLKLYRMKINGLFQRKEKAYHHPHTDWKLNDSGMTVLYYINNSDGPTYLFNQFYKDNPKRLTVHKKIPPKMGRMIAFEATRYHASSSPFKSPSRFVLNIVCGMNNQIG
jgi:hypothetical protein